MHPCLRVDEIVRHVASEGGASAVVLACCCKSFEDPALDALWETRWGLLPLLESLPADVWDDEERGVSALTIFVPRSLNHSFPVSQKAPNGAVMG